MKTKLTLCIASFIATSALALTFVTLSNQTHSLQFFKKNDPQTQEKIYNFLLKNQKLSREMAEKAAGKDFLKCLRVWRHYDGLKSKLDTSDLPEDFRLAWERKALSELEMTDWGIFLIEYHGEAGVETESQKVIGKEKAKEYMRLYEEFEAVIESYGIKYESGDQPTKIQ